MASKAMNLRTTQTKQRLINAFYQLVAQKDFEKITIADLTKTARINRATFYAHFSDKYDLVNHIIGDTAASVIKRRLPEEARWSGSCIVQLVLAVCDFYQPSNIQCRRSYAAFLNPQRQEKMLYELKSFLSKMMGEVLPDVRQQLYVPLLANLIHEAGCVWASGEIPLEKEELAQQVMLLVQEGFRSFDCAEQSLQA